MIDIAEKTKLCDKIKPMMSEFRFNHTMSVVKECEKLAEIFKIDNAHLVISAFLHDITKEKTISEQVEMCHSVGFDIDEKELNSPKALHALTASIVIPHIFPEYADDNITKAVRSHTTGKENMSLNEKLLFLADYIEETRKFDDCIALRKFFYEDLSNPQKRLDQALIIALKTTLYELINSGAYIHEDTVKAYNFLIKNARP